MLRYRVIFGALMIAFALGAFWVDSLLDAVGLSGFWKTLFIDRTYPPSGLVLAALTLVLLIPLASRELVSIMRADGVACHLTLVISGAIASCLTVYAMPRILDAPTGVTIIATVLIAAFVGTLLWHARDMRVSGAIAAAGATMFAVVLLGLMPGFYLAMRRWHSPWVVLAIILIVKSCDIGAYFTGRFLGKHKLIPWLSPGKTWEGLFGGIVLSSLVATGLAYISQSTQLAWMNLGPDIVLERSYSMAWAALAGAVLGAVGQLGDLMMSLFKRDAGFKDSGSSIPGFGGMLDVFDSPLLVAPVAFWLLEAARLD